MKTLIKKWLHRQLRVQIHRPKRGSDFFDDIDRDFGIDSLATVFDVGANIGQTSLRYAEKMRKAQIHAFEPVNASYRKLVQNTKRLSCVTCHEIGMGAAPGTARIHLHPDSSQNSICFHREEHEDLTEEIRLDTIDGFVEQNGLSMIDLLKIDAEGYEREVLRGATGLLRDSRIRILFMETAIADHGGQFVPLNELLRFLDPFGYRFYAIYDQIPYWDGNRAMHYCNVAFVSGPAASGAS
jgi:FkbM family methyltransferase